MACDLLCAISRVLAAYQLVTIPFYTSVLVVLIRKRNTDLNSSFFNFCISVGIADMCAMVARLLGTKGVRLLPNTDTLFQSVVYQTFSSMFRIWGFYYTQVSGLIILSFNRLTAVWDPFEYETFWTGSRRLMAYGFQWFFLLPFSLPQLHPCCQSNFVTNTTGTPRVLMHPKVRAYFWTAKAIFETSFCGPVLLLIWLLIIIKIVKHTNQVAPLTQGQQNVTLSAEKRYTIIGLVLCTLYFYFIAEVIYRSFHGIIAVPLQTLVVVQLFTCSNPYLLLIFSSVFRSCYIPFITFGKVQV